MELTSNPALKKFKNQNFDIIKEECRNTGTLWTDPEFPPEYSSLFKDEKEYEIQWLRPKHITHSAKVCVDGYTVEDVHQGQLGNCWFVAAITSLSTHPELLHKVMPAGQTFSKKHGYCGAFLFRFWHFGTWEEVVIDDYLPTIRGRPIYMHSVPGNEFWTCLVEKAYAKFIGNYELLEGGYSRDALMHLTSGVCIYHNLVNGNIARNVELQETVHKDIKRSFSRGTSVLCCSTLNIDSVEQESKLKNGLMTGHVYTILRYYETESGDKLMKLKNPWGRIEWNGRWSDGSDSWETLSDTDKRNMKLEIKEDGIFWMTFDEFLESFEDFTVCRVGYYAFEAAAAEGQRWYLSEVKNIWKDQTAGGCSHYLRKHCGYSGDDFQSILDALNPFEFFSKDTFWDNPQYMFDINDADDDGVQIVLCQPMGRQEGDKENEVMGFIIFEVNKNEDDKVIWDDIKSLAPMSKFNDMTQVRLSCDLKIGRYVVIPSTYKPGKESEFMLRVFSEGQVNLRELAEPSKPNL